MSKRKVVSPNNISFGYPLNFTIIMLIALDHWNASDMFRGVSITLLAIYWVVVIYSRFTDEPVKIFEDNSDDESE